MADPAESSPQEPPRGRAAGVYTVLLVLAVILLLLLVGSREEIARSWGISGERGQLLVEECWTDPGVGPDDESRGECRGLFVPADGGAPYAVEALVGAEPGERLTVGADGPDERAYRADLWGRWAAVALPLFPVALLWVLPWVPWMLRRPGRASRREIATFLVLGVAPATVLALLGVVGFFVALAIT